MLCDRCCIDGSTLWFPEVIITHNKHSWEQQMLHPLLSFLSRTATVAFVESLQDISRVISTLMETRYGQGWTILVHSPESVLLLHVDTCYQGGQLTITRLFLFWPLQGIFYLLLYETNLEFKICSFLWSLHYAWKQEDRKATLNVVVWWGGGGKDKEGQDVLHPVQYSESQGSFMCFYPDRTCQSIPSLAS